MARDGRGGLGLGDRLILLLAWITTCGLVYLLGFYVGKGTQTRSLRVEQQVVRLPVTSAPPPEGRRLRASCRPPPRACPPRRSRRAASPCSPTPPAAARRPTASRNSSAAAATTPRWYAWCATATPGTACRSAASPPPSRPRRRCTA